MVLGQKPESDRLLAKEKWERDLFFWGGHPITKG